MSQRIYLRNQKFWDTLVINNWLSIIVKRFYVTDKSSRSFEIIFLDNMPIVFHKK